MSNPKNLSRSHHLILGGARSGKSGYAEKLAKAATQEDHRQNHKQSHKQGHKNVIYIATAKVMDDEIAQRVARHKQDRPSHWTTIEEPLFLADTLQKHASSKHIILVDCLTMWLMNLLSEDNPELLHNEQQKLLEIITDLSGQIILVSNEVGMGIIPMGELTRKYVDEAGRLHQALAQKVDQVTLMVAGLPHQLKPQKSQ